MTQGQAVNFNLLDSIDQQMGVAENQNTSGVNDPEFIVDGMLGKLCRWLRFLGFNALYAGSVMDDDEIIKMSAADQRVIITSDRELSMRYSPSILIRSRDIEDQLYTVTSIYRPRSELFLTRCPQCNTVLETVRTEGSSGNIPDHVREMNPYVKYCGKCGKYYWEGTHHSAIMEHLKRYSDGVS